MPLASRIAAVDFARGLVLVAMTIDHLPGNLLEHFTPRNFALSDSAEAFVFLSGLSIGLVYYRRTLAAGLAPVARSCLKRAGRLYGVHILMTAGALAIFAAAYWLGGFNDALIAPHGRAVVFHEPLRGALGVALLSHQLGYFNILPLYVVLMAAAPAILALARFSPTAALAAALGAYGAVKWFGFDLPNWPEPGGWFFNPLAWQLVFTLGVLAGVRWSEKPPRRSPVFQALCLGVTVAGAADRHRRLRPPAGSARPRLRRARHRQAESRRGSAGQFPRPRLRAGDDAGAERSRPHVGGRSGAEPRPPQPAGFRRQLAALRPRSSGRRDADRYGRRTM